MFSLQETPTGRILKAGFTEKKGKIKWSPRRLVLFGDELHCFRIEEKDSTVYPLNLIRLTQMNVAPIEKNGLRLITHQRKYEFRFETEVWDFCLFFFHFFVCFFSSLFFPSLLHPPQTERNDWEKAINKCLESAPSSSIVSMLAQSDAETDDELSDIAVDLVLYKQATPTFPDLPFPR